MTQLADRLPAMATSEPARRRTAVACGAISAVALAAMLGYWGGAVRGGPLFVAGLAVLSVMIFAAGTLVWWLYASPLPARASADVSAAAPVAERVSVVLRQAVVAASTIGALVLITAAFWDTLWHIRYGVGAALNDFFWRPHEMIYGGMALIGAFALIALIVALRGQGGIRERFRREPLVGLLGVAAAYMGLSGPSDLLWHRIYGLDQTAWSLPHLLLAGLFALVMLLTVAIALSLTPTGPWRGVSGLRARDALCVLLIAMGSVGVTMILTSDYDGQAAPTGAPVLNPSQATIWARPEWIFPALLAGFGALLAATAVNALRRAGAATMVVLVLFALRVALFSVFGVWSGSRVTLLPQALLLAPALATDLWYATRLRQAGTGRTAALGGLIAGAASIAVALPLIAAAMEYPRVNGHTAPMMVIGGLVLGAWGGWVGAGIGRWVAGLGKGDRYVPVDSRVGRAALVAAAAVVAFATFFVVTAQPPQDLCRQAGELCLSGQSR